MSNESRESYPLPDDDRRVFPEHLIGAFWDCLQWRNQRLSEGLRFSHLHSEAQLAKLVYPAFCASLSSDEGRQIRFRLAFNPRPAQLTVDFKVPLEYSAGQLVKLAATVGLTSRWLVAQADHSSQDRIELTGLLDPNVLPLNRMAQRWGDGLTSSQSPFEALELSVLGPGWIRLSAMSDSFELRDCCFRQRLLPHRVKFVADWFREVPRLLGIDDAMGAALSRRFIVRVLARTSEARHGGCLLVVPQETKLASLPLKIKYEVDSDVAQRVIKERSLVGPKVFLKGPLSGKDEDISADRLIRDDSTVIAALLLDRDLHQVTELVSSFAAVDGAVVLSRDIRVLGFGGEITVNTSTSGEEMIEFGNHPPPLGRPDPRPFTDFGMRHRSAIRFCRQVPGAIAFVISQDGGIRLFHYMDGCVKCWTDLVAEEW